MPAQFLRSFLGRAILASAAVLLAAATASAQGYIEFRPATGNGVVHLLPAIADATATVSAYGYVTTDQVQYLYVGLSITNNGNQALTLQPATCAYTDDVGRRAAGAALFSGQTRLASATVAPGGRDDLQLGFPVLEDVLLAQARTITVDWTFTYAGRPYAAQAQFVKGAAGPVPAPPQPGQMQPVQMQPVQVPVQAPVDAGSLGWNGIDTTQYVGPAGSDVAGWGAGYGPWDNSFYGYAGWGSSPWSFGWGGWTIFTGFGDNYLFLHHRHQHGDRDDDGPPGRHDRFVDNRPPQIHPVPGPVTRNINTPELPPRNLSTGPVTAPLTDGRWRVLGSNENLPAPSAPTALAPSIGSSPTPQMPRTPHAAVPPEATPPAYFRSPQVNPGWSAPAPNYSAPSPRSSGPSPSFSGPGPSFSGPSSHFSAPAPDFRSSLPQPSSLQFSGFDSSGPSGPSRGGRF